MSQKHLQLFFKQQTSRQQKPTIYTNSNRTERLMSEYNVKAATAAITALKHQMNC